MSKLKISANRRQRTRFHLRPSGGVVTPAAPILSGGTVTIVAGYVYHTFTASDTLYVWQAGTVDWLLAGGGGAGGFWGGGGGGGKVLTGTQVLLAAGAYPVLIGAAGAVSPDINTKGGNGERSLFNGQSATGGGGGGSQNNRPGAAGGNGGGGAYDSAGTGGTGEQFNGGSASSGQGTGGGGGASQAGANASGNTGGKGGDGYLWLDGNRYGAGGGGSARSDDPSPVAGAGGAGGGGAGGNAAAGSAATANTGSGGGGGGRSAAGPTNFVGGAGAAGVFKVRYPVTDLLAGQYATGGVISVEGNYIRHDITASTTFALAQKGLLAITDGLVVGGGGGSGGGQSSVSYPAGGAGGEVNTLGATNITIDQTVTIGTGGAANGVQNGLPGTNGTSTIFGTINTATGGEAGGVDGVGEGGDNVDFNGGNKSGLNGGGGGGAGAAGSGMNGGNGLEWPASSGVRYGAGSAGGPSGVTGTGTNYGRGGDWNGAINSGAGYAGLVVVRYQPGAFQPGHPLGLGSNLAGWYDPTTGVTGGATVTQWNDQSANARNVTPGAAGSPSSGTRNLVGRNVIDFDGVNDGLGYLGAIGFGMTNHTLTFIAAQDDNVIVAGLISIYNSPGHDYDNGSALSINTSDNTSVMSMDSNYLSGGGGVRYASLGTSDPTPLAIWTIRKAGTTAEIFRNGVLVATNTCNATGTANSGWSFGWRASESGNWMNGLMGEIVLASTNLNSQELTNLVQWIKFRWWFVLDTMARADSSSTPGSPDVGPAYVANAGTWGTTGRQLYLATNYAVGVTRDANVTIDTGKVAQKVQVDIPTAQAGNSVGAGIIFRYVDQSNFYGFMVYRSSGGSLFYYLFKNVAGVNTVLTSAAAGSITGTLMVDDDGSVIKIYKDGTLLYTSGAESNLNTATKKGVFAEYTTAGGANDGTGWRFKNLIISP